MLSNPTVAQTRSADFCEMSLENTLKYRIISLQNGTQLNATRLYIFGNFPSVHVLFSSLYHVVAVSYCGGVYSALAEGAQYRQCASSPTACSQD